MMVNAFKELSDQKAVKFTRPHEGMSSSESRYKCVR